MSETFWRFEKMKYGYNRTGGFVYDMDIGDITYDKLIELTKLQREKTFGEFKENLVEFAKSPVASQNHFEDFLSDFLDVYYCLYDDADHRKGNDGPLLKWEDFHDMLNSTRDELWSIKYQNVMASYQSLCQINRFLREVGEL